MTETKAITSILIGSAAWAVALLNRKFYWRKGWFSGEKEAPGWIGRLFFASVGTLFIFFGAAHLLLGY